jgi:hypothetical protein
VRQDRLRVLLSYEGEGEVIGCWSWEGTEGEESRRLPAARWRERRGAQIDVWIRHDAVTSLPYIETTALGATGDGPVGPSGFAGRRGTPFGCVAWLAPASRVRYMSGGAAWKELTDR